MTIALHPLPRPAATPADLVVEVAEVGWMMARARAWDALVAAAAYPNPHFSRRVIAAHLEHGLASRDLRFLVVRRGAVLLAVLPFSPKGARVGLLRRASTPFGSPYVTNATPLVAANAFEAALAALADGMAQVSGRAGLWRLPLLAIESRVGQGLLAALEGAGLVHAELSSFGRAVLDRRPAYADFERSLKGKAKELRRCRKRLTGMGLVEHRAFAAGPDLAAAVEAFLDLERAGWKGQRGTALACRPDTAAFARAVFGMGDGPVAPRADVLSLEGRPVAVSLALICGGTASLLKTTYDESLRACAPGLLLEDDIVRACHETRFADRLDAATVAGSVMDRLYPDRETIADVLVSTRPGQDVGALVRAERRRLAMREGLKGLVDRVRSR